MSRLPAPLFVLCLLLLASGCTRIPVLMEGPGLTPRLGPVREDVATARMLTARSLAWRSAAQAFRVEARQRLDDGVLTSADLVRIERGGEDYVFLRRRWQALQIIQGGEAWRRTAPKLSADPVARLQTKLVLAAALMQFDDFRLGVLPYFGESKARRLLRQDFPALDGELDSAMRGFMNPVHRQRLANAVVWYKAEGGRQPAADGEEAFLDEVIEQSPGYQYFSQQLVSGTLEDWARGGHAAVTMVFDQTRYIGDTLLHVGSMVVGNSMGLVQTRGGYLATLGEAELTELAARLHPGDVLLDKTPFRLTDMSIPGHYGHVAVWVGTETELRAVGLWEHPLVKPHQEAIRAGARIIEALRPGVQINTLRHFMDVDDLLVLRPPAMEDGALRECLLRAFAQVGKDYDFNFDVETDRRIVCSELAFVVFPAVRWETSRVLGRSSITPDQVAQTALVSGGFEVVLVFHDGVELKGQLPVTAAALLRQDYAAVRKLHPGFSGRSERE